MMSTTGRRVVVGFALSIIVIAIAGKIIIDREFYNKGGPSWSAESASRTANEMIGIREETIEHIRTLREVVSISDGRHSPLEPRFESLCGYAGNSATINLGATITLTDSTEDTLESLSEALVEYWAQRGFDNISRTDYPSLETVVWSLDRADINLFLDPEDGLYNFSVYTDCRYSPDWKELVPLLSN